MGSAAWRNASSPIILGLVNPLNTLSFPIASNDGVIGMVTCFLLFPSLLLLPWFADRVLYEREEELYHQMAIAGLRPSAYWLGNYLFDSTVSWLWCASLIIAGYASGSPLFVSVTPFLWLLLYLVWIHAQLGVAWFITVFFTRRRAASVLIYLFVIVVSAGSFGYSAFLYSRVSWPWYLNLLPPLTFMRALSWVVRYPLTVSQALAVGSPFADSLNATLWIGTAMMAIAVLAHALRYQSVEQLLSAIPWYKERSRLLKESEENKLKGDERIADAGFLPIAPDSTSAEDEDVQLERQRVIDAQQSAVGEARAISILNLRKSFTSGGWADRAWTATSSLWMSRASQDARRSRVINAVNGLFLGMDYGDCFGLLGPNGAGKVRPQTIPLSQSLHCLRLLADLCALCACVADVSVDDAVHPQWAVSAVVWPCADRRARRRGRPRPGVHRTRHLPAGRPRVGRPHRPAAPDLLRAPQRCRAHQGEGPGTAHRGDGHAGW